MIDYPRFIEDNFQIVNKELQTVPFRLNKVQDRFDKEFTNKVDILKARQQGFSSYITAMFTTDFILTENSYSISVADIKDNATMLLEKVKFYIESYESITGVKVPLKYDSKNELYNPFMNSRYHIGTAKNTQFGRSRTVSNLHFSEVAFYPSIENMIASAGQAVVEGGNFILETTANGFNDYKKFRDRSKRGETNFKPLFFPASEFYTPEFLEGKRQELGRLYGQEYPDSEVEAFVASGQCYFDTESLREHLKMTMKPGLEVTENICSR